MSKQGLFRVSFWSYLDNLPRVFQTVVPMALRKSLYITILEKNRNVPNGLLKMCPRLEPQRHFEAACCSGITISAVARVSCMSVCKMRPPDKYPPCLCPAWPAWPAWPRERRGALRAGRAEFGKWRTKPYATCQVTGERRGALRVGRAELGKWRTKLYAACQVPGEWRGAPRAVRAELIKWRTMCVVF